MGFRPYPYLTTRHLRLGLFDVRKPLSCHVHLAGADCISEYIPLLERPDISLGGNVGFGHSLHLICDPVYTWH